MRVLIIGSGGREHALAWKIAQSPLVKQIFCAPGNAGMASVAELVPINVGDIEGLARFAEDRKIDLTVVGPEAPLIAGIVDVFESKGLPVFGPSRDPARIEGSKAFAKDLMREAGIPTAEYWNCHTAAEALARVREYFAARHSEAQIVLKADGIAAGKGVLICRGEAEAKAAVEQLMLERVFGAAGDVVVIEECLVGEEASIMAITDGEAVVPLLPSQDHKRIGEGDTGLNTGGMGAYAPVPVIPSNTADLVLERILRPAIRAIRNLGIPYKGVLYAGVMVTSDGPKCIEFNCRLGDPETQVVLPMLDSDIIPLLLGVVNCELEAVEARWRTGASACVVAASGGYPAVYETGKLISGLELRSGKEEITIVFHAGTRLKPADAGSSRQVLTDGGRVLSVTGIGPDLPTALARAYERIAAIQFEGMYYRRDIGQRALRLLGSGTISQ